MNLDLVLYPDARLTQPSLPCTDPLPGDLVTAMQQAVVRFRGYALAACQVGHLLELFVVHPGPQLPKDVPTVLVNPRIVPGSEAGMATFHGESCLSLPKVSGNTRRWTSFDLDFCDDRWVQQRYRCEGLFAVVAQHELDHLAGRLFIDRLDPWERGKAQRAINKLRRR